MSPTQQLLIDNLKTLRKEKKITQTLLAQQCDMLPSTYSRLESGQVSPQLQTLERVCEVLEIDVVQLFQPREINEKSLAQKLDAVDRLSEQDRSIVEIIINTVLQKAQLEKAQELQFKNRLEELKRVKGK